MLGSRWLGRGDSSGGGFLCWFRQGWGFVGLVLLLTLKTAVVCKLVHHFHVIRVVVEGLDAVRTEHEMRDTVEGITVEKDLGFGK